MSSDTIDYAKLKVEDIRHKIVEDSGGKIKLEDVDQIKGKKALVDSHKMIVNNDFDGFFKELEVQSSIPEVVHVSSNDAPSYNSPEWENFLLSQLTPEEKDGDYPKVNGLRRLAETFLGEIVFSGPVEVRDCKTQDNSDKTVVVYAVKISWNRDAVNDSKYEPIVRTFQSVASSWYANTDNTFIPFAESIADTRAEARALRRALRISKVSSDEMTKRDTALTSSQILPEINMDKITDSQKTVILSMCERHGIDLNKFINSGKYTYSGIEDVSRSSAIAMIQRLNDYQNCSDKSALIPEDLKVKE